MKKRKNNSVQELLGIKDFRNEGVLTNDNLLIFFSVAPSNISVLSKETMASKIESLMQVFSSIPNIGIICIDSCQRFDTNKSFIEKRIKQEKNPYVRDILRKDMNELEQLQMGMSSARQFMFYLSLKDIKKESIRNSISRAQKTLSERGFESRILEKEDVKRFLSIYFGSSFDGDEIADFEGEEYIEI